MLVNIKIISVTPPSVCKGIYTYKYILITLGGVIEIILAVSTSVTDQNE
jgi:hypothetical protein